MKTLCIFLSAVMLFVLPSCGKREETAVLSQEEINELNNAYLKAKENGDYISMNKAKRRLGDKDECAKIADRQSLEENDFIVMDYSFFNNPCFQVRNSYKAENDEQIRKVIDILLRYDKEKNTPWERSKESMEAEWFLHNFSYEAQFETERAMHVDFDNKDEDVYK